MECTNDTKRDELDKQLMLDASSGLIDEVALGIANGANVNCGDEEGRPPIFYAIVYGRYDLVKLLIEKGACLDSINMGNGHMISAYSISKRCEQDEIAEMIKSFVCLE